MREQRVYARRQLIALAFLHGIGYINMRKVRISSLTGGIKNGKD